MRKYNPPNHRRNLLTGFTPHLVNPAPSRRGGIKPLSSEEGWMCGEKPRPLGRGAGFTLLEVIIGTIILAVSFGGLLSAFVAARTYTERANKRLIAINLARGVLNDLYNEVKQDTWDSGRLRIDDRPVDAIPPVDSYPYTGRYKVESVAGKEYRQVTVTITYPD